MSRQTGLKKDFTFVGGLNTDGGYLTAPQNAWIDGLDVEPFIDGHVARRVRLDLESGHVESTSFDTNTKETSALGVLRWKSVGGNGSLTFAVVQQGATILFYDCSVSSLSPFQKSFTIDLTPYKSPTTSNVFGTSPISIASGNGKLVICSADTDPILVKYDLATDTIGAMALTLQMRDFDGVTDTTALTERPSVLSPEHHYNLLNQGWTDANIDAYQVADSVYPSNVQIWIQGKDSTDTFSPDMLDKQDFGTGRAPRGRFILNIFSRDRSNVSTVPGIAVETEDYRPAACCFFAGRTFYAGIKSTKIGSWVIFSGITTADERYQQCYQQGDPTAEFTNELLASDGGVIPIPDAGGILALHPIQDSIIVFAQNGIWQILGGTDGFKADSYQIKQISSFGLLGVRSIVEVENTVLFWSPAGIFSLIKDNIYGIYNLKSLSLGKIETFYNALQNRSDLSHTCGFYDQTAKKVYWLYRDGLGPAEAIDRYIADHILVFNVLLGAFYAFSIPSLVTNSPFVVGGFSSPNVGNTTVTQDVILTDGTLVVASAVQVVATLAFSSVAPSIPKFLTLVPFGATWTFTFSDFINTNNTPYKFRDWYSVNGTGTETSPLPYILTNYEIAEDASKTFQTPYLLTFMYKTETGIDTFGNAINGSSCMSQTRWDWTDDSGAGRWSTAREVYRHRQAWLPTVPSATYTTGYPLVVTKSIVRGHGSAMNIKWQASQGLDMKVAGWSMLIGKNANV